MGGDTCSTHHASWGKFIQMLCYRAERDDGRVVRVNPIWRTIYGWPIYISACGIKRGEREERGWDALWACWEKTHHTRLSQVFSVKQEAPCVSEGDSQALNMPSGWGHQWHKLLERRIWRRRIRLSDRKCILFVAEPNMMSDYLRRVEICDIDVLASDMVNMWNENSGLQFYSLQLMACAHATRWGTVKSWAAVRVDGARWILNKIKPTE